jgi:hypothetical protein
MAIARIVWLVGGASVVFVGSAAGLGACSSSTAGGYPASQDSGSHADTSSGGSGSSSGSSGSSSGSGGSSGSSSGSSGSSSGGTCDESPPQLYTETSPGVYCPFAAVDGGKSVYCAAGQHCCETPESAGTLSTCEAMGTACPVTGSIDWQCEEAVDCTAAGSAGPICCGTGTQTSETCGSSTWPEFTGFNGTMCVTSCPAPGITVCEQQSDCTTGTCTASKADGNQFGFCM